MYGKNGCPQNFTCRTDINRCVAEDSNDWAPPQLLGDIVITPDKPGKQGQESKLIFAVNEPLAERDEMAALILGSRSILVRNHLLIFY